MKRFSRFGPYLFLLVVFVVFAVIYRDLLACRATFFHDSLVWFGSFHYYIDHIIRGEFPYWDPYSLAGTYFYPNIAGYGLLDPACLIAAAAVKFSGISTLTAFIYFRLYRLFLFAVGAFFFFRFITKNAWAAAFSSTVLMFGLMVQNQEYPMMDYSFTIPLSLYLFTRFADNPSGPRRYLDLALLVFVTGITINVFIPSVFLFNISVYAVIYFVVRRDRFNGVIGALRDKKLLAYVVLMLVIVIMMSAPPLSVTYYDTSDRGELFAVSKLVDASNLKFKRLMATELGGDILFDSIQKGATFLSYNSLLSLVVLVTGKLAGFFAERGYLSPSALYIGVIPLLIVASGYRWSGSVYGKILMVMLALNFVNAFGFSGANGQYNILQKIVNTIFFPLRMIDTRINTASVLIFYLCSLLSVVLASVTDLREFVRSRLRVLVWICIFVAMIQIGTGTLTASSSFAVLVAQLLIFVQAPLFLSFCYCVVRGYVTSRVFIISAATMALLEIFIIHSLIVSPSFRSSGMVYSFLSEKEAYRNFSIAESHRNWGDFEMFRLPSMKRQANFFLTFAELMTGVKCAMPENSLSNIFTTRRYYDLLSNLDPDLLMAVQGVYYPIVRFFAFSDVIKQADRRAAFEYINNVSVERLGERPVVEKGLFVPPFLSKVDLASLKDIEWYDNGRSSHCYNERMPYIMSIRMNERKFWDNYKAKIAVSNFSVNRITIMVDNYEDGYLIYDDGWSKYWKAYDNGSEIHLLAANYNSKAVYLAPGRHQVQFVFDPHHYRLALYFYYSGLVMTAACVIYGVSRMKKTVDVGTVRSDMTKDD